MVLTATGQHLAKRARILPRAKFGYKVPTLHLAPLLQPGELLLTLGREEVQESYGRTWGEVGLGAQTALGKATYLFGDVRYQHSLNGKKGALGGTQREGYHGRIGVRHTW